MQENTSCFNQVETLLISVLKLVVKTSDFMMQRTGINSKVCGYCISLSHFEVWISANDVGYGNALSGL
jgi:hypothetical protein